MTTYAWSAVLVLALLALGWRLSRLAARRARAQARVERSWRVLDRALAGRAQRALEVSCRRGTDPATTLLVGGAAAAALEPGASLEIREEAESRLSLVLDLVRLAGLEPEQERVALARRLHNDAVCVAASLRRRRWVRVVGLGGRAEARAFEMLDGQELLWSGGLPR